MSDTHTSEKRWKSRWFFISLILSVLGTGSWAGWTYIQQAPPTDNLVVLRADPAPFRVKPAEGTQAKVPHQESTFMALIDGSREADGEAEIISLSDPSPEPPPVPLDRIVSAPEPASRSEVPDTENADGDALNPEMQPDIAEGQDADNGAGQRSIESKAKNTEQAQKSATAEQAEPEPVDLTASLNLPAPPKPRPNLTQDKQGQMMVQLAAFKNEDKARTAAALLNQKHQDRLKGYSLGVRSVTSTDGQLFWRVITDPLPGQAALSVCDGLKRAGQDCILRHVKAKRP